MASSTRNVRVSSSNGTQSATNISSLYTGRSGGSAKRPSTSVNRALPPRAKSVYSKPSKPQTRTLKENMTTTTVFKTQSDTSLVSGMRNLSVRDRVGSAKSQSKASGRPRAYSASAGQSCRTVEDAAEQILSQKVSNIVVMVGAGISTSSGIPDFRTPGTGLYDNLRQYKIPYPEAIFDVDFFESCPKPFFTLAKELYPTGKYRPNYAHYFLRLLHEKGALLRVYTQNIDGLERFAGIPPQKLVEAHGTFLTASCSKCKITHSSVELKEAIFSGKIPRCRKGGCFGLVKPDIVFFGEDLPKRFYYYLKDFPQADMLIVMGTSLEVEPFAGIVDSVRLYVPRILFNRKAVGPFETKRRMNDVISSGDIVGQLKKFVKTLGWEKDIEDIIAENEPNGLVGSESGATSPNSNSSNNSSDSNQSGANSLSKGPATGLHRPTKSVHRLYNTHSAKTAVELSRMRQMVRIQDSSKIGKSNLPLPRLVREKPIPFHCQKSLYRKAKADVSSSSSEANSSSEESSSDDE